MQSLKTLQSRPIGTSIGALLVIITAGWAAYRPILIRDLSADFVTKTELNVLTTSLNGLAVQVNVAAAFQMERGFQEDLDKHEANRPDPVTSRWVEAERKLTAKRDLAEQYRNCVLKEEKNCGELQKQLWQ